MDTRWRIQLLGDLRAERGDRIVTRFRTQRTGLLLAYLAYYRGRPHLREGLIETLWPDGNPSATRANLRDLLRWLRRELEASGEGDRRARSGFAGVIRADRLSIQLDPELVITDVAEFETALQAAAGSGDRAGRADHLGRAVDLYHGPLLPGYCDDWVLQERGWLAERHFQALEALLLHLEEAGDLQRALDVAQRGVRADPLREEAHVALMRLYHAAGQSAAALRQYHELERLLREQLDAPPALATQSMAREIERDLRSGPRAVRPVAPARAEGGEMESRWATVLAAVLSPSISSTGSKKRPGVEKTGERMSAGRLPGIVVDAVLKYEGRVEWTSDDRALALFGTLRAHEDDPERALRAAIEIRDAARRLGVAMTAGVHTGEIALGMRESPPHPLTRAVGRPTPAAPPPVRGAGEPPQSTGAGAAVDLAITLQAHAARGQIVASGLTSELTRRTFDFAPWTPPLPPASPVPPAMKGAHLVQRVLPRSEKPYGIDGPRAPLIGRDEELARLRHALDRVLHPGSPETGGQMVCLLGEAGLGKSRLVAELRAGMTSPPDPLPEAGRGNVRSRVGSRSNSPPRAGEPGTREAGGGERLSPLWLEGRCQELGMSARYWPFLDILRQYLGWGPEDGEAARARSLVAALEAVAARGELSSERVEEIGPVLGHLLSLRFGNDWDRRLDTAGPEQLRYQSLVALQEFFVALARQQPLVLVLEDLHWADGLSLDLISLLIEALPPAPLCLLCVYRPEREHRCGQLGTIASRKCPERLTEIRLRALTASEGRRMVESLLPGDRLPTALIEGIEERAHGNPLFVEELIRSMIVSGTLYREEDAWRAKEAEGPLPGVVELSVPESLQAILRSRVERLEPALREVLQCAAVIGRLFRPRLLAGTLAGMSRSRLPVDALRSDTERVEESRSRTDAALRELEQEQLLYQERVLPEEEYSFQHVLVQEAIYGSLPGPHRAYLHRRVGESVEQLYPGDLEARYETLAYHYERSDADEKAIEYLLKAGEKARRAYLNDEAIQYFRRALERLERAGLAEARAEWRLEAIQKLGYIYLGIGKQNEAAEQLRHAIALGRTMGLPTDELVRLYFWLGDALFWQNRMDEMLQAGEEGLALVGGRQESIGTALMNHTIGLACCLTDPPRSQEFYRRNAQFLDRIPYCEELRPALVCQANNALFSKDLRQAEKWALLLEQEAERHHDLRGLASAHNQVTAIRFFRCGDLHGSIRSVRQGLELYLRIGDLKHARWCLETEISGHIGVGDISSAVECYDRLLHVMKALGSTDGDAKSCWISGRLALCRGAVSDAVEALQRSLLLSRAEGAEWTSLMAAHALGRAYLRQGAPRDAARCFEEAAAFVGIDPSMLHCVLSGMEEASEDPEAYRSFCRRFRQEQPESGADSLIQWRLDATEAERFPDVELCETFQEALAAPWSWHDPFGDCSWSVGQHLEIRAANGRDLWDVNRSAPRFLRPASGYFAIQVTCRPVSQEPAIGGLLLWKDDQNYLRLDRGVCGPLEVSFQGCINDRDAILGRGRLLAERVVLRLERIGSRVNALCSADGERWFTVGHVEFPVEDPVEVGLHAIGMIDRTIYHGAYPTGTAIRFERFSLRRSGS
jgi:predicted ATPase/DNA-binding SARP family transcriptional activator